MTPERAKELLNTESTKMPGFKLIDVGCIRNIMTAEEVSHVSEVWRTLPGSASFHTALNRISIS